ncbi:MAG: hypothetical protein EOP61_30505 [Sphingomonadales bacterium]|nr:MAG: hypothetical protein EOP61_30505 [Sphingomonadales bacterium]
MELLGQSDEFDARLRQHVCDFPLMIGPADHHYVLVRRDASLQPEIGGVERYVVAADGLEIDNGYHA